MQKEFFFNDEKGVSFNNFLLDKITFQYEVEINQAKDQAVTYLVDIAHRYSTLKKGRLVFFYKVQNKLILSYFALEAKACVTCDLNMDFKIIKVSDSNKQKYLNLNFMELINEFQTRGLEVYILYFQNPKTLVMPAKPLFAEIEEIYNQKFKLIKKPVLSQEQKAFVKTLLLPTVNNINTNAEMLGTKIPLLTACFKFSDDALNIKNITLLMGKMPSLESDTNILLKKDPENFKTALHYAVLDKNIDDIKWICSTTQGQALYSYDDKGKSPFDYANENIKKIIRSTFAKELGRNHQIEALMRMIRNKEVQQIKFHLPTINPSFTEPPDVYYNTPLGVALNCYMIERVDLHCYQTIILALLDSKISSLTDPVYSLMLETGDRKPITILECILDKFHLSMQHRPFIEMITQKYAPALKKFLKSESNLFLVKQERRHQTPELLKLIRDKQYKKIQVFLNTFVKVPREQRDIGVYDENPLGVALQCFAEEKIDKERQLIIISLLESETNSLAEIIYPHWFVGCNEKEITILEHFLTTFHLSSDHRGFIESITQHYAPTLKELLTSKTTQDLAGKDQDILTSKVRFLSLSSSSSSSTSSASSTSYNSSSTIKPRRGYG